jgi:hypothetical protein
MLPLFALLLFALLGLGALVVDGGLAFSEQARLDAAAESVALEWSHARALPASTQPTPCLDHAPGTRGNDDCLRAELLAPLLEPLGLAGASDANPLADSPRSLDGTPLAPRGAQLGALTTAGVLEPASDDVVRLTRSTPMLLGWAALPAYAADDEPLDFAAVQALRAQDGISPRFEGTDLRTRGFQVEGQARLAAIGAPAMRVGAMLPGEPDLAGSVGMAWRLDALESLAGLFDLPASARTVDLAASATSAGDRIQLGTVEVGCSFDLDPDVAPRRGAPDAPDRAAPFGARASGARLSPGGRRLREPDPRVRAGRLGSSSARDGDGHDDPDRVAPQRRSIAPPQRLLDSGLGERRERGRGNTRRRRRRGPRSERGGLGAAAGPTAATGRRVLSETTPSA